MQWRSEYLYFDNDDYFRDLIEELSKAQTSVDIEAFTFEDGKLARRLLATLAELSQRGVVVRLICDGWGSPTFWNNIGPELRKAGVRIKVFRPLPWRFFRNRGEPISLVSKFWQRLKKINRGFHRKLVLIDRKVAWVGSLNITDVHLKEVYGRNAWADVGGRFEGEEIFAFQEAFEKAFYSRKWYKQRRPRKKTWLVLMNDSWLRRRKMTFLQKLRLKRAKQRIWIQNPYFIPERSLLRALIKAAKRKVDMKIIIPEKNDQMLVRWMSFALYERLVKKGIQLYEYQPRFAHKKVIIVDQLMTIGSNNFNHRSFLHDLEVEVLVTKPDNKQLLETNFLADLAESRPITLQEIRQRNLLFRWFCRALFFFRYFT